MHACPPRPLAATLRALALLAALATAGCGGTAPTAVPAAPAVGAATAPTPSASTTGNPGATTAQTRTADDGADRAAQLAVAETVLRALGAVAAGGPFPAGLRPEVREDLARIIDGTNGVGNRCLVEFTVTNAPTWQFAPAFFVPLLNPDGSAAPGARDEGVRVTATGLEGYRTAASIPQRPPGAGATPGALPPGSVCAPATPGTPVQLPDERHRALRGEMVTVLVEWREGAWAATEVQATGAGFP